MLDSNPWIEVVDVMHCTDERKKLESLLESVVGAHDAVILTGGVSMGDHDYVPDAVRTVGGEVVFHGLPVRCLLYTSPSPRDLSTSRMPSSA